VRAKKDRTAFESDGVRSLLYLHRTVAAGYYMHHGQY